MKTHDAERDMWKEGKTLAVVLTEILWREVTGEDITNVFWATYYEKPLCYIFEEIIEKTTKRQPLS